MISSGAFLLSRSSSSHLPREKGGGIRMVIGEIVDAVLGVGHVVYQPGRVKRHELARHPLSQRNWT